MEEDDATSMKVTITGGTGQVAEFVIKELEDDYDLVLFDRVEPGKNRFQYEIKHPVVVGELLSIDDCEKAVAGSEAIIHLGAIPFPAEFQQQSTAGPQVPRLPFDETMRVNTMGTFNVLEAARRQKVKVVVTSTSNCVLGHVEAWRASGTRFPVKYLPIDENHPKDAEDSYSLSKQFQEEIMHAASRAHGIRTYGIRPAVVMRVERQHEHATNYEHPASWSAALNGYADIRDVARAFRMCLHAGLAGDLPPFDDYYVNNADTWSLEDSRDMIERLRPDLLPLADGITGRQSLISAAKATKAFGWRPEHSWTELIPR
jgi:nucleoside-diphosphate-sugar epimerase